MGEKSTDRSFAGGEISPDMYGRVDLAKYQTGLATCRNAFVLPHGPVENRPGTEFVAEIKNSANAARLIPFTFNFTQTMAIEVGAGYFRFHTQAGTLLSAGVPYEVANSYAQADLMNIHYTQSADVLTLVHPNYPVAELRRLGATNWALTNPSFAIPTYCPTSASAVATTPHATTWNPFNCQYCVTTVQVTDLQESIASNVTGAVNNDLTLVGNINTITWALPSGVIPVRFNVYKYLNGLWGYIGQAAATATSFIDNNITPNTAQTPPIMDSGFNDAVGNYPGAVTYFQQRRCFAGSTNAPQNAWWTMSGTESNMTYTLPVQAQNRISFKIAAREASGIRHLVPIANLVMLTASTEWRVSSTDGNAVWAGNISVQPQSYVGANNVTPIVVGNALLFSQSRGCRIREMSYNWQSQAYLTNDISVMASHLFDYQNILDMTFSKAPYQFLHCVTSNGNLASLTYVPEQQVAAWHHHEFSGFVESVCTITEQPAGTVASEDMLYLIVNRVLNGVTRRYVERLHTRYFNTASDAFFVDSGATNFLPGTFAQQGTTITCNIPAHGVTAGQSQYFTFSDPTLSGTYSVTTVIDVNNITLTASTNAQELGTVAMTPTYQVTTVSGLTWLANQTVNVLADGAPIPLQVVSATGTITLPYPATKVIVGLPITCQVQTLPAALTVDAGFGETLQKNVNRVYMRVFRSSGGYVGPDANNLTYSTQRSSTDLPGSQPALASGVVEVVIQPDWNFDGSVFIQQTDPLPLTICSIATDMDVR
ncbi:hypothetical protein RGU70_13625 [Herbaspirillum sp. RTI4]|uniref:hypothetical protein n=1 Tax=Herbaspirillum sp. RTI4 TaxID=3048640 RepID=UPI002AB34C9B|nr:hypothetical protein [Herbaspirillum sp. RTI4]MDY7579353.1 hypothetical protein [Herbaspirillum sp. RTI4]MEA9980267.1 hypothetical protein [Herbaspirillum sp. RTI4]